jgi:hypothetical protein
MSPHGETDGTISTSKIETGNCGWGFWDRSANVSIGSFTYCQMGNHYHLLIETPDSNLAKGMHQHNGVYTQGFDKIVYGQILAT